MATRRGRIWTEEERKKQAERIRSQKPWLKSTGPRTARGKLASSRNAVRHGCYGAEFKMICLYLRMQKIYSATLRFYLKHDLFDDKTVIEISGNELNKNPTKSIQNATDRCVKTIIKSPLPSGEDWVRESQRSQSLLPVIPAKAGIQKCNHPARKIPAFAGMTLLGNPIKNPPFLAGSLKS